ncbi:unnamed protein product [Rhizopus stolonifer]
MNFKNLQYSIGKLKSNVQTHLAKNNPMQKQDTKSLSLWIFEERNDLASMRTLGYQRSETNKALKTWISEDMTGENTKDLEDIVGDKLVRLLDKQVQIDQEYTRKYQQYRQAIKSIREREDKMSDVREKKRSLQSRIQTLTKSSAQSPKLSEFQKELRSLEHDTAESEIDLANFKRFALKEAFYLRLNAMHAHAEKTALIAGFGKYLVDLIEIEQKEYESGPQAAIILADCMNALDYWKPAQEDERSTFALDTKGKAPLPKQTEKVPPKLPPRNTPTGNEPQEVQQVTSDLKTENESELDLERIDLYDAPPPAYAPSASAPLNADRPGSFYSPYQSHAQAHTSAGSRNHHQPSSSSLHESHLSSTTYDSPHTENAQPYQGTQYQDPLYQDPHHSPYQETHQQGHYQESPYQNAHQQGIYQDAYQNAYQQGSYQNTYQESPYPTNAQPYPPYQNTPYQTHASPRPAHLQASYSTLTTDSASVDYHQLYRQASQRQQVHHEYRPYEEFQQRYGVDAGGFRVPPPLTAEQEKEQLARYYENEKTIEEHKPENKDNE